MRPEEGWERLDAKHLKNAALEFCIWEKRVPDYLAFVWNKSLVFVWNKSEGHRDGNGKEQQGGGAQGELDEIKCINLDKKAQNAAFLTDIWETSCSLFTLDFLS